jgi:hypothetical protein
LPALPLRLRRRRAKQADPGVAWIDAMRGAINALDEVRLRAVLEERYAVALTGPGTGLWKCFPAPRPPSRSAASAPAGATPGHLAGRFDFPPMDWRRLVVADKALVPRTPSRGFHA